MRFLKDLPEKMRDYVKFPHEECITKTLGKQKIGVLCSYVPEEIIYAAGFLPVRFLQTKENLMRADACLHNNLCPYVRSILETVLDDDLQDFAGFLFVNSCDAMRRLYDAFRWFKKEIPFVEIIDLPRNDGRMAMRFYESQMQSLLRRFREEFDIRDENLKSAIKVYNKRRTLIGKLFDLLKADAPPVSGLAVNRILRTALCVDPVVFNDALSSYLTSIETRKNIDLISEKGPRILIMGAIFDKGRLIKITEELGGNVVGLDVCTGFRHFQGMVNLTKPPLAALAERYIKRPPCARMKITSENQGYIQRIIHDYKVDGIIYHTIKFCDFYSCNLAALKVKPAAGTGRFASKTLASPDLPLLHLESDFSAGSVGQHRTRIGAFLEMFNRKRTPESSGQSKSSADVSFVSGVSSSADVSFVSGVSSDVYVAGIDSGSLSTDCVILNRRGEVASTSILRTGVSVKGSALDSFHQALEGANLSAAEDVHYIVATGYGRKIIDFADAEITEISCHAKGASHLFPSARTIIDIGGQDSKVIRLDEGGNVAKFAMNDKCAAGTGRFLEVMARALEMDLTEMGEISLKSKNYIPISSMCTVFAESEVISLLAEGRSIEDIVYSLNVSICNRILGLVQRAGGASAYAMTGGVAKNIGVVKILEEKLGEPLLIYEEPQIVGALGAALFALERLSTD